MRGPRLQLKVHRSVAPEAGVGSIPPLSRVHCGAFLLTTEEQMPLHEASISALAARRTGAHGARPSALG
jgi:hypothetical protein